MLPTDNACWEASPAAPCLQPARLASSLTSRAICCCVPCSCAADAMSTEREIPAAGWCWLLALGPGRACGSELGPAGRISYLSESAPSPCSAQLPRSTQPGCAGGRGIADASCALVLLQCRLPPSKKQDCKRTPGKLHHLKLQVQFQV